MADDVIHTEGEDMVDEDTSVCGQSQEPSASSVGPSVITPPLVWSDNLVPKPLKEDVETWGIHPCILRRDDSGVTPPLPYPDSRDYVWFRDWERNMEQWAHQVTRRRRSHALLSGGIRPQKSLLGAEQSTQSMGTSTGTSFRFQFLNFSQYNFHAFGTGPSTITMAADDVTEFGADWPVWNMSTVTMNAPNLADTYRGKTNLPWNSGSEWTMAPVASPHVSTPATITSGMQTVFACKDVGMIPMQIIPSNLAGRNDVTQDFTGYIPTQKSKFRVKYKLGILATLTDDTDYTSIGSYWMHVILFKHRDPFLYSGFRSPSDTGSVTPVSNLNGIMPQSSAAGVVTPGWSNQNKEH